MKNHLLFNVKNCIYNLPAFQCDNAERVEPQKKVLYNTSKYMSCTCIYNTFNQTMYFPRKNNKKKEIECGNTQTTLYTTVIASKQPNKTAQSNLHVCMHVFRFYLFRTLTHHQYFHKAVHCHRRQSFAARS